MFSRHEALGWIFSLIKKKLIQREEGICPKSHKASEKVGPRRQLQRLSLPKGQRLSKMSPNLMITVPNKERVGGKHSSCPES